MPRIRDDILEAVIYLYASKPDAQNGARVGGSGFLIGVDMPTCPGYSAMYVVTNRHVIEQGSPVIRINTHAGGHDVLELTEENWIFDPHGDDLAVCPLVPDQTVFKYRFLQHDQFVTRQLVEEHDLGPGEEVFIVGRFVNQEGRQRNVPSVRFGNIAQMPIEPLIGTRPSGHFKQESFIVEARSIPGYSGSPVFVYIAPLALYKRRNAKVQHDPFRYYGPWLLGVDWCHINDYVPAVDDRGNALPFKVRANSGMMGVIPAWRLDQFLNIEPLKELRAMHEKELLKSEPPSVVSMDASAETAKPALDPQTTDANPTHREDFTRLLTAAAKTRARED